MLLGIRHADLEVVVKNVAFGNWVMAKGDGDTAARANRAFLMCVDAMNLGFVRDHIELLPNFQRLLQTGAVTELTSPANYMTASGWQSFAAGAYPGEHGHYYPFMWRADRMKFVLTTERDWIERIGLDPFWHKIARAGVPTISFDVGFPVDQKTAPCLTVTNWSFQSTGRAASTDEELLRELVRRFGHRPIGKEIPVPKTLRQSRALRDSMIKALRAKTDATLWLMKERPWRLFVVGYYEVHRAGHNLLVVDGDFGSQSDPDALLDVYKAQDKELGRLIDALDNGHTTIAVFALHGMAPNRVQDHFLSEILARLNAAWLHEQGEPAAPKAAPSLIARLRNIVPFRLQYALAETLGESIQDWVVNRTLLGGLNWSKTPSFRLASGGEAYIRFAIEGRERAGYFKLGDPRIEAYRRWLEARLLEIRDLDTGGPLFSKVCDTSDLFPGPKKDFLPDLIALYAPEAPSHAISSPIIGEIHAHLDTGRGGNHTGDAFITAIGPGASNAAFKSMRDITDIGSFAEALLAPRETPRAPHRAEKAYPAE